MKRLIVLGLLLAGCAQRHELSTEPIALTYAQTEASKTDALTAGDEVWVYASVDGTQNYFLNAHKFVAGSDGRTLTAQPAVFYPDPKQAATFYAYFGSQSVPADQSTAAALKQADLCWASASSTPSTTAVPLSFSHVFARLTVACSQPTSKILISSAFSGGTLDIRSGVFTNGTKSDVFTTQNELIVPAQTLNRLIITSNGIDYVFDGSIALESGKTTTVNLTLNTATKTAKLSGSSITQWVIQSASDIFEQQVSNSIILQWIPGHSRGGEVDKIVLTIKNIKCNTVADYVVSSGVVHSDGVFRFDFASQTLNYPYEVQKVVFKASDETIQTCVNTVAPTLYKSGLATVGLKDAPINTPRSSDYVVIGGVKWAKGNLIGVNNRECKIGNPTDFGLYFQFGSLIGWKSGDPIYGGTGQGAVPDAWESFFWQGRDTFISFLHSAYVWPESLGTRCPALFPYNDGVASGDRNGLNDWYFNYNVGSYSSLGQSISDFNQLQGSGSGTLATGRYAALGVGDPCSYYLGPDWRTPTAGQISTLASTGMGAQTTYNGRLGRWFGPGGTQNPNTNIFVPVTGNLNSMTGGTYWSHVSWKNIGMQSCTVYDFSLVRLLRSNTIYPGPLEISARSSGFVVRCVGL